MTCDAVINAVQAILTPTQFSVFGEHPKVGVSLSALLQYVTFWSVQIKQSRTMINIIVANSDILSISVELWKSADLYLQYTVLF